MYSVLMPVSPKEDPHNLQVALSSLINQTLISDDIVIIKDGLFTKELDEVVNLFINSYQNITKVVVLSKPQGSAAALNIGLNNCKHSLVARMDSDDISLPNRFKLQYDYMVSHEDIDVVGGFINEFSDEESPNYLLRKVPLDTKNINSLLIKRNSMNHVTVMFRKSSILSAGGYVHIDNYTDYFLWVRLVLHNKKMANLEEVLVNVRAGESQIKRRGGLHYISAEINFFRQISQLGFLSKFQVFVNVATRFPFRIAPLRLRLLMYKLLRYFDNYN